MLMLLAVYTQQKLRKAHTLCYKKYYFKLKEMWDIIFDAL